MHTLLKLPVLARQRQETLGSGVLPMQRRKQIYSVWPVMRHIFYAAVNGIPDSVFRYYCRTIGIFQIFRSLIMYRQRPR